ncbi:MAG TPA: stage V sporulation protein T [Clostridiales bacterium]|jgi:AbrB family transcriptional regulator (stage V sporulation protein T)|nr:stage V sporulation protein T [Clostridiales bacterium]HCG35279.1 stage V sporulation protein T [Clostridiales bacterium]
MKATGIVRRIDDLGRIVIPKEIRRTMRIREGDPLEIFTNHDGEVIFKKYSPVGELFSFAAGYCEILNKSSELTVAVCDRDTIVACAGIPKKEYVGQKIPAEMDALTELRQLYTFQSGNVQHRIFPHDQHFVSVLMPIIVEGDLIGAVISFRTTDSSATETEIKLIQTAAAFFAKQLEA